MKRHLIIFNCTNMHFTDLQNSNLLSRDENALQGIQLTSQLMNTKQKPISHLILQLPENPFSGTWGVTYAKCMVLFNFP